MKGHAYDDGYRACRCFWGREPGSLVRLLLARFLSNPVGQLVLDAGCGEGKNAYYLANLGAQVLAVDVSAAAIANARDAWPASDRVQLINADIMECDFPAAHFGVVLAYGLLHCLPDVASVLRVLDHFTHWTAPGGHLVICSFNSRTQDLSAHPGFSPVLMSHSYLLECLTRHAVWQVHYDSDADLYETHPHNGIPHVHAVSRVIARRSLSG